jgi:hypothetical protein
MNVSLKSHNNISTSRADRHTVLIVTCRPINILYYNALNSSYNTKSFKKICRENKTIHFIFSVLFFRKSCRLSDNVNNIVQLDRPQMAMW